MINTNYIFPKKTESSVDRVYTETKELASKCAEELGTYKTVVYWLAIQEFYKNNIINKETVNEVS